LLASQILDRVCEDLYAPKEGIAAAMVVNDPASICSQLMWACFRTHDIMSDYIEQNFENHPAISAEYIKFLATNSGSDRVEKVEGMMKTMAAEAKVMSADVAKAVAGAEKAAKAAALVTDKYSAANKEVETLKKRILVVESGNKK
jgi:predicted hydrolase (HD superfamily)